jgi:pimeloyl-ACP methyl ester carboxylesterase
MFPDESRTTFARSDDHRRIAYAEYGDPDGIPVVFFHGTPGSRLSGRLLHPAAAERGVRVLAVDRPGYGRSPPWDDRSFLDAGAFLAPVLDDVGVRDAHLVAFSGGSPHALAAAIAAPDRVAGVDVIAGATPPAVSEETPRTQRLLGTLAARTPIALRGLLRGQAWLAARLDPSVVVSQYTADGGADVIPDAVAEGVRADFLEAFARSRRGAVAEFAMLAADWGIPVSEIGTDVRLRHGEADTNVPIGDVRRFASRIPTASLRVLEGDDHLGSLLSSAPDVFADVAARSSRHPDAEDHDGSDARRR